MGEDKGNRNLSVVMRENAVISLEADYTSRYEGYDPNSSESLILSCRGRSPRDMEPVFSRFYHSVLDFSGLYARKNQLMDEVTAQEGEHLKVGALTLLRWLKKEGYTTSLATSTDEERASHRLQRLSAARPPFSFIHHGRIISAPTHVPPQPQPQIQKG